MDDLIFMKCALALAEQAGKKGEIPIGACVVKDGIIIGEGANHNRSDNNPVRHAEIDAIESACRTISNERLTGSVLYVTKEPCAMCAGAIIHSRIDTVYIGARDDKYGAAGTVFDILGNTKFNHVPKIIFGLCGEESAEMLRNFFGRLRKS